VIVIKSRPQFISHLKNGLDDGSTLNEKNDADKIWKEFLKKDPERVVNTIHTHWLEQGDNKNATVKEMKEFSDSADNNKKTGYD